MPNPVRQSETEKEGREELPSAVTKAFSVLRLLRRSPTAVSVSEVARSVHVAASTAHSILQELQAQGAVTQDADRRYRLGPATYYLGAAYARSAPISRGIWNELTEVARELSVTAAIATPWENHHLILNVHQDGDGEIEVALGGRVPIDAGSWGKAYYAWSLAEPGAPTRFTSNSITDPGEYRAQVERARERGYATDGEEFTMGVGAVAAGVTSERGFEGVASLMSPIGQMNELGFDVVGRRLAGVASRASFALGDLRRMKVVGIG
jgi:IclR family transcriptional regulator, acetate operon repressor